MASPLFAKMNQYFNRGKSSPKIWPKLTIAQSAKYRPIRSQCLRHPHKGWQMVYFQTKIPIWVNFGLEEVDIFMAILYNLRPFGIFLVNSVYFTVIWYIFPRFGMLHQEQSGNPDPHLKRETLPHLEVLRQGRERGAELDLEDDRVLEMLGAVVDVLNLERIEICGIRMQSMHAVKNP
jgi:hypothetical protein